MPHSYSDDLEFGTLSKPIDPVIAPDRRKFVASALAVGILVAASISLFMLIRARMTKVVPIGTVQSLPVGSIFRVAGTVTFIDVPNRRFWLQDAAGALVVPTRGAERPPEVGESITVVATKGSAYEATAGPGSFNLKDVEIKKSTWNIPLPEAVPATLLNLPDPSKNGIEIRVESVVRDVDLDEFGRSVMWIGERGRESRIIFENASNNPQRFVNSLVRLTAVPEQIRNLRGGVRRQTFYVSDESKLQIIRAAPTAIPLYSIRDVYRLSRPGGGYAVRMRGRVSRVSGSVALLEDDFGAIEFQLSHSGKVRVGDSVEVRGFLNKDGLRFDLVHATASFVAEVPKHSLERIRPLERVADVRSLPAARAAEAVPVHVQGVVTYNDPIWRHLYIQDGTSGIYVKNSGEHPEIAIGQTIEVMGLSGAGDFAPVIVAPKLKVLDKGVLPRPIEASADAANSGILDSQFVSIDGIVHPLSFAEEPSHPILTFQLYTSIGRVYVSTAPGFPDIRESQSFEDAKVQVSGVFGTIFNSRRQLIGYEMKVSTPSQIRLIEPSITDTKHIEVSKIGSLLSFTPASRSGHRVKVKGTVTFVGENLLYVQDSTGGVEVHANEVSARVGQFVEVIGYPSLEGRYSPILTDSEVHLSSGDNSSITTTHADPEQLLRGSYNSQLVSVDAKLIGFIRGPTTDSLLMQSGSHCFSARLDTTDRGVIAEAIREGSVLRLTGIATAQVDSAHIYKVLRLDPVAFSIHLRSPEDVEVIQSAPFWTLRRLFLLLGIFVLLTTGVLVWVAVLRKRVISQTAALDRASQTAQAIRDLSGAMEKISAEESFETEVSVRGTRDIMQLVIGFNRMLSQLRQRDRAKRDAEGKLQLQALFDELTGLPNRRLFSDRLSQSLAAARREGSSIALLYIDLDGFKLVNDSFGHVVGDLLLREVAERLGSRIREADTLARLGGDEFTVIINHIGTKENAEIVADTLLQNLRLPFCIQGHDITLSASIGVAMYPNSEAESDALLEQADCAMYAAKRDGKNRVLFFSNEIGSSVKNRFTLENELRNALNLNQISIDYQPEFDLETNAILCFEALARWKHPELGSISPAQFIPVAEESGLIVPLGSYVMEQACREALRWQACSDKPVQVAVNVSTHQFVRSGFLREVKEILNRTGLPPTLLQIELTESAMLRGMQHAETLKRLREMGISVAIDDFGTGYSCLSYLPKLAFNALKIDRSFVQELGENPNSTALIHSILGLARNLSMRVIVEGIENNTQLALIKKLGGNEGQGFLLGRPSPDPTGVLKQHYSIRPRKVSRVHEVVLEA